MVKEFDIRQFAVKPPASDGLENDVIAGALLIKESAGRGEDGYDQSGIGRNCKQQRSAADSFSILTSNAHINYYADDGFR